MSWARYGVNGSRDFFDFENIGGIFRGDSLTGYYCFKIQIEVGK